MEGGEEDRRQWRRREGDRLLCDLLPSRFTVNVKSFFLSVGGETLAVYSPQWGRATPAACLSFANSFPFARVRTPAKITQCDPKADVLQVYDSPKVKRGYQHKRGAWGEKKKKEQKQNKSKVLNIGRTKHSLTFAFRPPPTAVELSVGRLMFLSTSLATKQSSTSERFPGGWDQKVRICCAIIPPCGSERDTKPMLMKASYQHFKHMFQNWKRRDEKELGNSHLPTFISL